MGQFEDQKRVRIIQIDTHSTVIKVDQIYWICAHHDGGMLHRALDPEHAKEWSAGYSENLSGIINARDEE